jgi:hypothetical protein
LDARYSSSEERRHCHKLIGTIPIVRVWQTQGNRDVELPTHQFPLLSLTLWTSATLLLFIWLQLWFPSK